MPRPGHHHGNLHEALIKAGMDMLAEGEALTLRGAAQRAGVSHAAPAHHFKGLSGLRTAIAARAMQMLADRLENSGKGAGLTHLERLVHMGRTYCNFAARHVYLFHLMFASPDVDRNDDALLRASVAAYAQLSRICKPFALTSEDRLVLEHSVWSLTHGNAVLLLQSDCRNAVAPEIAPPLETQYRLLLGMDANCTKGQCHG